MILQDKTSISIFTIFRYNFHSLCHRYVKQQVNLVKFEFETIPIFRIRINLRLEYIENVARIEMVPI